MNKTERDLQNSSEVFDYNYTALAWAAAHQAGLPGLRTIRLHGSEKGGVTTKPSGPVVLIQTTRTTAPGGISATKPTVLRPSCSLGLLLAAGGFRNWTLAPAGGVEFLGMPGDPLELPLVPR